MLDKNRKYYYFLLGLIGIIFFFLIGEGGVILTKDSLAYIDMEGSLPDGYIIYPTFVRLLIAIFGEKYGLTSVWLAQSLLALITSLYITEWIRKRFKLSRMLSLLIFVLSILPYAYTLPEYVETHEVMTEGLAIPLFNIIFILLLRRSLDKENKIIILISLLLLGLIFIRPQLLTICMAVLCVYIISWINGRNRFVKKIIYAVVCIVIIVVVSNIKPIMLQVMERVPQFSHAVSGKVLLTIEMDDRNYFVGIEQEAFDYVYNKVDKEKNRMEYIERDLFCGNTIMTSINYNTKYYFSYFKEFFENKETELPIEMSEKDIRDAVLNKLFIENFDRYVGVICQLFPYSFVAAIFVQPEVIKELCYVISAVLYSISFILWICVKKRNISKIYSKTYEITMIILVMNILFTNTVFYAQQRYIIYTFGWFYISILLLIYGLIFEKQK